MKLHDYLKQNSLTPAEFATLVGGVSEFGVRKWASGERIPRQDAMRKIIEATGGQVASADFFEVAAPPPASNPDDAEATAA